MLGKHTLIATIEIQVSVWQSAEYIHSPESRGSTLEVWVFARTRGLILSQQFGFPDCSRLCWGSSSYVSSSSSFSCAQAMRPVGQASRTRAQSSPVAWVLWRGRKAVQKLAILRLLNAKSDAGSWQGRSPSPMSQSTDYMGLPSPRAFSVMACASYSQEQDQYSPELEKSIKTYFPLVSYQQGWMCASTVKIRLWNKREYSIHRGQMEIPDKGEYAFSTQCRDTKMQPWLQVPKPFLLPLAEGHWGLLALQPVVSHLHTAAAPVSRCGKAWGGNWGTLWNRNILKFWRQLEKNRRETEIRPLQSFALIKTAAERNLNFRFEIGGGRENT